MSVIDFYTCDVCGKRTYYCKGDAKTVRRMMGDGGLGVYHCEHANGWHLGHKPRLLVRGRISRDEVVSRRGGAA